MIGYEELKEIVEKTRCYRRFKKVDIMYDELTQVIDLARITSSARNLQPLRYIIVTKQKYKEEVFKPLRWAGALVSWNGPKEDEKPSAYIIVCADKNIADYCMVDAGIAMQTIMLALTTKGYSSCILASIDKDKYKEIFKLQENIEPLFAIAIGKAGEKIKIVESENVNYYRNEKDEHCVPKRNLDKVIIGFF